MKNSAAQENNFDEKLLSLASTIDNFEGYANSHSRRIAALSKNIAQKFFFPAQDLFALQQAALIHDVGELVMNRQYLQNSRELNDEERNDMQRHPVIGEQETARRGYPRQVQLFVRWHHEWWNGAGYPDALQRESIPLGARILRVADTYCALTDKRPFRAALSETEARKYLTQWSGIEFDPQVVKYFLGLSNLDELKSFQAAENNV